MIDPDPVGSRFAHLIDDLPPEQRHDALDVLDDDTLAAVALDF